MSSWETNNTYRRYVVFRPADGQYYNGRQTFGEGCWGSFEKAKVFKNKAGAKAACLHLTYHRKHRLKPGEELDLYDIVEVEVRVTGNSERYEWN